MHFRHSKAFCRLKAEWTNKVRMRVLGNGSDDTRVALPYNAVSNTQILCSVCNRITDLIYFEVSI